MKSTTKFYDLLSLIMWANLNSTINKIFMPLAGIVVAIIYVHPKLQYTNPPVDLLKLLAAFTLTIASIILLSLPILLVTLLINTFTKGCLGEKNILHNEDEITERSRFKETTIKWSDVKYVSLTKNYIFIRFSFYKYIIIPKRDFANEADFANYYAKLAGLRYGHA